MHFLSSNLPSVTLKRRRRPTFSLLALAAVAVLVAACGSSSSNSSSSHSTAKSNKDATLSTTKVPGYGEVLATGKGQAVYMFTNDPKNGSKCTGTCASTWKPVTVSGKPTAGSSVTASMLSTFKRGNGETQVAYNGYALYTRSGVAAGSYAGMALNGGVWYLVSTSGKPIKSTKGGGY